jgi:hypothetical protein
MIKCFKCGKEIMFDSKIRSSRGIKIPLDSNREFHVCKNNYDNPVQCLYCGFPIYFEDSRSYYEDDTLLPRSIAIDYISRNRHYCDNDW